MFQSERLRKFLMERETSNCLGSLYGSDGLFKVQKLQHMYSSSLWLLIYKKTNSSSTLYKINDMAVLGAAELGFHLEITRLASQLKYIDMTIFILNV